MMKFITTARTDTCLEIESSQQKVDLQEKCQKVGSNKHVALIQTDRRDTKNHRLDSKRREEIKSD